MALSKPDFTHWTPAGPVAEAYELDQSPVSVILGPIGSGKTTASVRRCWRVAGWQDPSPIDGVRRAKVLVVTPRGRVARDTIAPVFERELGGLAKSRRELIHGDSVDATFEYNDVELTVMLRSIADLDLRDFYLGIEVTGVYVPDLEQYSSADVLALACQRMGRYPSPQDRPPGASGAFAGVWGDVVSAQEPAWLGDLSHISKHRQPDGYDPFSPDGFSDRAENQAALRRLCPNYYQRLFASVGLA